MRFATRTFFGSFLPFALLLSVSFWAVRAAVIARVRDSLRDSVRESQVALNREQARNEARNRSLLEGIADTAPLKAGLDLMASEPSDEQARNTVQDQLSEIGDTLKFDFLLVSRLDGTPMAAVIREGGGFVPVDRMRLQPPSEGIFSTDERLYETTSVTVSEGATDIATLTVGSRFDISRFGTPAVLLRDGAVVTAQMRDLAPAQIEDALGGCQPAAECDVRIHDERYLSLPLGLAAGNGAYSLRTLQSVDAASAPIQTVLRQLFLFAGLVALLAAVGVGVFTARSIASPLADVVSRLRRSSATGDLPEFSESSSRVQEIRELTDGFNQAAKAIREGRENLMRAYVQFVGSLAQALDARDAYTAGHSRRVSEYSCAIARAMNLPEPEIELIRVGALLHDLGKIGISDLVLQKPGRLTPEEEALIRQHPVIGRRILENVHGLEPYLGMVELHHENCDGTGYPRGLKKDEIPLHVRIVKVADAYDAMTSDRPYRRGMSHLEALATLRRASGPEMDPDVVEALAGLGDLMKEQAVLSGNDSLKSLANAVRNVPVRLKVVEEKEAV